MPMSMYMYNWKSTHIRNGRVSGGYCIKTVSPKRVVTIDNSYAHFLTISGHFFANHINIFHKTEVQWSF